MFALNLVTITGMKWWLGGTIHIQDLGVGCRALISIHSRYITLHTCNDSKRDLEKQQSYVNPFSIFDFCFVEF